MKITIEIKQGSKKRKTKNIPNLKKVSSSALINLKILEFPITSLAMQTLEHGGGGGLN